MVLSLSKIRKKNKLTELSLWMVANHSHVNEIYPLWRRRALLLSTSLIGFLHWGDQSAFVWEVESDLLLNLAEEPSPLLHPFIVLPLLGQIILAMALFRKIPSWLELSAIGGIALLYLMLLLVGLLAQDVGIIGFSLPYLITATWHGNSLHKVGSKKMGS